MKNNNLIPSLLIACGLFAVALKPAPQLAPIPQADPVALAAASVTGPTEPTIEWYGTSSMESPASAEPFTVLARAWTDGTFQVKLLKWYSSIEQTPSTSDCTIDGFACSEAGKKWFFDTPWITVSSGPDQFCSTDVNSDGEVDFGDLLEVLGQWGEKCDPGLPIG